MKTRGERLEELRRLRMENWRRVLDAETDVEHEKWLERAGELSMESYYVRNGLKWPPTPGEAAEFKRTAYSTLCGKFIKKKGSAK